MHRSLLAAAIALGLSAGVAGGAAAQAAAAPRPVRFAVLGHIRGDADNTLYALLPELLEEVRALEPDFVVLTGDIIWGEYTSKTVDRALITRTWDQVDSAVKTLGVPVYRVPGNHDISDPVTRDVYFQRYGTPPQTVDVAGTRLILLNSSWTPAGSDTVPEKRPHVRGVPLDAGQIAFVRQALADTAAYRHAFVFTHHLLWFDGGAPWWKDVHPLLAGRKVRAVFSGDLGPMKFAHMERDSVQYYQTSMEGNASVEIQRVLLGSRLIGQQFDNFLLVSVDGPRVDVDVKVFGATSAGKFTPQRWAQVSEPLPPDPLPARLWNLVGSPARLAALAGAAALLLGVGYSLGVSAARRRAGRAA